MQLGFFDMENRLGRLSEMGDALERINPIIDWEIFRPIIEHALQEARGKAKGPGGRPAFDCILMFKILFLQRLYHLSDDQTEYQINDRLSFMRFLGLWLGDKVVDAPLQRPCLANLISDDDEVLYADSAYSGKELLAALPESVEIKVHKKGSEIIR